MLKHCAIAIVIGSVGSLAGWHGPAGAQDSWGSRDYEFASRMQNDFISRFERDLVSPVQRGVRSAKPGVPKLAAAARPAGAEPGSTFFAAGGTAVPARTPRLPQQMAAAYPPGQRAQAQRTFEELLSGYRRIEQQFGIEPYDVASGVAAFLAGSYMGYHNTGFPDENFKPLVVQMQLILAAEPGWANASVTAKQDMYEQLAILGMLMANTQMGLKKQPNPQTTAAMKEAAKGYLEQFLKVDAAKVQLTAQGLTVR